MWANGPIYPYSFISPDGMEQKASMLRPSALRNLKATRKNIMIAQVNSIYYVLSDRHIISRATLVHIPPTSGRLSLRKSS